jgi:predicted nuclease of predicted toxin-antitoxin system
MSLRFFADHCVPNSAVAALRDAGHEVLVMKEHIAPDSDDPAVLAKAQELNAVLISLNGDFADIGVDISPVDTIQRSVADVLIGTP